MIYIMYQRKPMITTILEFIFTGHYLYDADNSFNKRIKNAKILNKLSNIELADRRLKKALFYYGLEMLDKMDIAQQPVGIVFGNLFFREAGRITPAELKLENGLKGNVYVAIVKNHEVVTLILMPLQSTNGEIAEKIKNHDGVELKALYDMDTKILGYSDSKRKSIVIDLDMADAEFDKIYRAPVLKNNQYQLNGSGVSNSDMVWINKEKDLKPEKIEFSLKAISPDIKSLIKEKEFVIYDGMTIFVPYPDGPKQKKIKKLIFDKTGSTVKYILEFENTMKPLELTRDMTFIISPKMQTDEYKRMYQEFGLEFGTPLNFQGPIVRFNPYSKEKTGNIIKLGIIINPRNYF